ncbi:MAG: cation diffusion facilitator family transporter [Acidimicrobiales bacterium]
MQGHDHPHGHGGAGHGHAHSHDPAASLDSALESSRDGMRALGVSLAGLAVTAALQLAILLVSGSASLLADTIHNFADALTALPLAAAFWLGRRPPDRRYTYGYGRAEDLAGIFVILLVVVSSGLAGWVALHRLVHPSRLHHLRWVVAAGMVGVVGNELVAQYRLRVGRRIASAALVADGYHARADGLTSLGVVAGATGVALGWQPSDPVFGLAITLAILASLKGAVTGIYRRLMDAVDPELVDQITAVLGAAPGIEAVEAVRVRWVGHHLHAEAEVVSDADLTLSEAHERAETARHLLLHDVGRLSGVIIHTSPCSHHGTDPHAATAHHRAADRPLGPAGHQAGR